MAAERYRSFGAALIFAATAMPSHAETIRITMDKLAFSPAEATAKVGDTVEWINDDILSHTATARNGDWDVTIAAKKTEPLALKKAGTDREKLRDAIEQTRGWVGTQGVVNMSPTDHIGLSIESLHIVEIRNGQWVPGS